MQWASMNDGELAATFARHESNGRGANEPFDELVRRHSAMIFRTCRRVTGNTEDAEDAMQLVFAALAENAGDLSSYRALGGWLYSTSWHIARHVQRSQHARRRYEYHVRRDDVADKPASEQQEALGELYRALEMLPPEHRDAVVLHHLEGLTIEQVSELLGCSPGTVASRLSRGRSMMRERLVAREKVWSAGVISWLLTAEWTTDLEPVPVVLVPDAAQRAASNIYFAAPTAAAGGATIVNTAIKTTVVATAGWTLGKVTMAACASFIVIGAGATAVHHVMNPTPQQQIIRASASASGSTTINSAGEEAEALVAPDRSTSYTPPTAAVPEPTMLAPLALAFAALRRRRR
jgi:RNA polymerase sigma factor (sigma-70 family)